MRFLIDTSLQKSPLSALKVSKAAYTDVGVKKTEVKNTHILENQLIRQAGHGRGENLKHIEKLKRDVWSKCSVPGIQWSKEEYKYEDLLLNQE